MTSHTREDIRIIARCKAIKLLAEGRRVCKDVLNSHEWAEAFANYIEAQPPSDKLAFISLFSLPSPAAALPPKPDSRQAGMRPAGP